MKIAVLLTCFNRKAKTITCLESLFDSQKAYNGTAKGDFEIEIFLTDDGCTDGTADALLENFPNKHIHILQGTGSLFWAGGMRFAWKEAQKRHREWSYYLLLNDDVILSPTCFYELFSAEEYCQTAYRQSGIISGITCSASDPTKITYGGDVILNKFNGRQIRLGPSSQPQMVDLTNANIMLVPSSVVDKIGIFYDGYIHSGADNDYSMMARRRGIPVVITASVCGVCENEHHDKDVDSQMIINMSLSERKAYYNHPLHSSKDYLTLIRRNMPMRFPLSWLFRTLLLYCPKIYYMINGRRGI